MPGNEVADKVHNFFEQDNLSQGQHQSQVPSGNRPQLNNSLWVGNHGQVSSQPSSNLKNYGAHQLDSERGNGREYPQNPHETRLTQLSSRAEFVKSQSRNQQLSLNGFMPAHVHARHNQAEFGFHREDTVSDRHLLTSGSLSGLEPHQGKATEHQPMMTRNLGSLENVEAPTNIDFLGGQQQLMRGQQPLPRLQPGFSEMPLWQQNIMIKQLQELQRQRQFQLLDQATRQQNLMDQTDAHMKQASGQQLPPMVNGVPIHNGSNVFWPREQMGGDFKNPSTSQMSMGGNLNWAQQNASFAGQGSASGSVPSHEQGQMLRSMGLVHQQFDQSLYGAPVTSSRGPANQYPNQVLSHDRDGMLNRGGGNQVHRPTMQSAAFSNSFHGNQSAANQNQNVHMQELHGRQGPGSWLENIHGQAVTNVPPSQSSVSLDPTEKKILFDTGENLWEAPLGGSVMGTGGFGNSLEGGDCFPSLQSGSWSALMQSAVAEASSSDTGIQDEWSGLNYQAAERSSGNQLATFSDGGMERSNWVDNSMPSASSLTSGPSHRFDDPNMDPSSFQQPGNKLSFQQGETVSHKSIQETSTGAGQWSGQIAQQNLLVEGIRQVQPSMMVENANEGARNWQINEQSESSAHSAEVELNAHKVRGSWVHRKSTSSYNSSGTNSSKQNGWSTNDSPSQSGDAASKMADHLSNIQYSQKNGQERGTLSEKDNDSSGWKTDGNLMENSFRNQTGMLEQVNSGFNREASHINKFTALANSSASMASWEKNQHISNRNHVDYEQQVVDSRVKYKGESDERNNQHLLGKDPRVLESSVINSERRTENCKRKRESFYHHESSNDSQMSNQSHHTVSGGGLRRKLSSSASESHALTSGNHMPEGQFRAGFPSQSFQHRSMRSLDDNVDPVDPTRRVAHSEALSEQAALRSNGQEGAYFEQSRFVGHVRDTNINKGKGSSSDVQGNLKGPEVPSTGTLPGYGSGTSGSFDGRTGFCTPNQQVLQASQNMLELIHKVDQSREQHTVNQFGRPDTDPLCNVPESETNASVPQLQANQHTSPRGFGLRLGPPSQRLHVPNQAFSPQNSSQTANNLNSRYINSQVGESRKTSASTSAMQTSCPSHEISGRSGDNNKFRMLGHLADETLDTHDKSLGAITPSSFNPRNELDNQQISRAGEEVSTNSSIGRHASHFRQPHGSLEGQLADQSAKVSFPGATPRIPPSNYGPPADSSQPTRSNMLQSRIFGQHSTVLDAGLVSHPSVMPGQQGAFSALRNVSNNLSNQQHVASGRHYRVPQAINTPNDNPATTSFAIQKPNDQDTKKGGNGSSDYGTCLVNSQQSFGEDHIEKENSWQHTSSERTDLLSLQTSANSKGDIEAFANSLRPSVGQPSGENQNAVASSEPSLGDIPSEDKVASGEKSYPIHSGHPSLEPIRSNPQVTPTWFERHRILQNGQMFPMYDAQGTLKNVKPQFILGKASEISHGSVETNQIRLGASQIGGPSAPTTLVGGEKSPNTSPSDYIEQNLTIVEPKKQRSAALELLPWHKEVAYGSQRPQSISMMEQDWARAANRIIDKLDDETEMSEDGRLLFRSRRRLIMTAQLMQQLFRPPPAAMLSSDATTNYESVTYTIAKSALGDACSLVSYSGVVSRVAPETGNTTSTRIENSKKASDLYFSEVADNFITRAKKLESDLLRVENRPASVLDIRVEGQDLERFSVINRFAKFHGRGNADTSSSSNTQKITPQRYVVAHPMPRNIPLGAQCLSL